MTLIPHRTVASQVALYLREELRKGTWRGWLPGERALCAEVQTGRNTLRTALAHLRAEGLIEPVLGQGTRIIATPQPAAAEAARVKTVGLIIPEPVGRLRPFIALWIDELKDLLLQEGCRLRLHAGRHYYQTNPTRALERLVSQHEHEAWVLTLSSPAMQRWFARRRVPCLVAGSTYADVELPHYDLDCRAICRHAAGVLLRLGHRRLALLNRESRRAGDVDSEAGFLEGVRSSPAGDATVTVAYHRDDVASVERALAQVWDRGAPPTAILVSNTYAYLATASLLAQRGCRIPQNVSLISRDDDPFLEALTPEPARYRVSPLAFAKKLIGPILQLVAREKTVRLSAPLLPKFTPGKSLARYGG